MSARHKARKRALDILFAADLRQLAIIELYNQERSRADAEPDRKASWQYAAEIVLGVADNLTAIDEQITTYSVDWPIERMPGVDRSILRLASWEILYNDKVPTSVAINEAMELAKEYSTDNSPKFINGVLAKIAQE